MEYFKELETNLSKDKCAVPLDQLISDSTKKVCDIKDCDLQVRTPMTVFHEKQTFL